MKVIGKIALGVCALALFGGVFFSCANAADGSSSNQTLATGGQPQTQTQTQTGTEQTQTQTGTEQTQTQTQTSEYTKVWTGTSELGWAKGDNNGEFISNDKISSSAKGLRITYTTDSSENHCLKFLQGDTWADIVVSKVEGSGTLANSGADAGKAVWLWKSQTNTTVTIFWTSGSEDETKVLSKGIKVYGDGATLTKIELYTPASTTTGGQPQTQTQTGTEQTQTQTGTEQTQTQTGTEQTQTPAGGSEQTQTAATVQYTSVFEGSKTIDWGDSLTVDHAKFTAEFNAVRVTYNATAGAIKLAVSDKWKDITLTSASISAGSIADDGAFNLPTGDAQTVTIKLSDADVAGIKGTGTAEGGWGGLSIMGANTITITKVESVKQN